MQVIFSISLLYCNLPFLLPLSTADFILSHFSIARHLLTSPYLLQTKFFLTSLLQVAHSPLSIANFILSHFSIASHLTFLSLLQTSFYLTSLLQVASLSFLYCKLHSISLLNSKTPSYFPSYTISNFILSHFSVSSYTPFPFSIASFHSSFIDSSHTSIALPRPASIPPWHSYKSFQSLFFFPLISHSLSLCQASATTQPLR